MKAGLVKRPGHIVVFAAVMCGTGSGNEKYQRSIVVLQSHGVEQFTTVKKYVRCNAIRKYRNTPFPEGNVLWQLCLERGRCANDSSFEPIGNRVAVVLYIDDRGTGERSKQDGTEGGKKSLRGFCYGHIIPGSFPERAQMVA
jgi:hypothetical protein